MVNEKTLLSNGNDSIVIKKHIMGIEGGRVLDVTGFAETVIKAGHIIIKTEAGEYAPMPVSGSAYAVLPENATYVGVLKASILTKKPYAAITTWGIVNEACLPYAVTSIKENFLKACPHIEFTQDEKFTKE